MKWWIAFWNILAKDMRAYYLKPPNVSWGLIFPLAWTGMLFIKSGSGLESVLSMLSGVVVVSILFGTTSMEYDRNPYYFKVDEEGQQLPYIDGLDGKVHQAMDTMVLDAVAGAGHQAVGGHRPRPVLLPDARGVPPAEGRLPAGRHASGGAPRRWTTGSGSTRAPPAAPGAGSWADASTSLRRWWTSICQTAPA